MKKITLSLLAMLLVMSSASAQISEGEPHFNTIPRTGNRPQAGTIGLYLGASVGQVIDLVENNKDDNVYWALPALNFKYYFTNNWEGRIGFEFACQSLDKKLAFDGDTYKRSENTNFTRFLPGFAYHFNTKNILDVYVGAQMPIGFEINQQKDKTDNFSETKKQNTFIIGGGVFMGLQVFIADLPFAIGIEAGYSGYLRIGGLEKSIIENDGEKTIYVDNQQVKSASQLKSHWGADAAITFSYYFNR